MKRVLPVLLAMLPAFGFAAQSLSLSSENWLFRMDPEDKGTTQSWWLSRLDTTATIKLPGSMTEGGFGDEISTGTPWTQEQPRLTELFNDPKLAPYLLPGKTKIPFWLTPNKYYVGPAWYQREISIPEEWDNKEVTLNLERAHWRTDVWMDDVSAGGRDGLSVPHRYTLGNLSSGNHMLTIRVDNRLQVKVGLNAHSVTDHTQTNWNGIIGDISLLAGAGTAIHTIKVYPDPATNSVRIETEVTGEKADHFDVVIRAPDNRTVGSATFNVEDHTTSSLTFIKLNEPAILWDEFTPNVYTIEVQKEGESLKSTTFGFRNFATSGTEFLVNKRPTFLRGTLECCIFPMTGYPPADISAWRRIMLVLKNHGLNHLRFHSWCPPKAAFDAADQEGVYFSVEVASWAHPGQDEKYDAWLEAETRRILAEYGNHPSFCMLLYGNEPGGNKKTYHRFLNEYVTRWDADENRILISGGAGWPALPANQFHILQEPRIQHWGEGLKSRINARSPETTTDYTDFITSFPVPVISHEIGQWCVYPNLEERGKYTGVTRALNFDIFEDTLTRHHMRDQAGDFLRASGRLQAMCYKEDIESALRTKGMGGFQLLDLHDFPGQGTALVGVLDPFWDEKGYISAEEYRAFTGPVVPLVRLSKRVFTNNEILTATIEIANYGSHELKNTRSRWILSRASGEPVASGEMTPRDIPVGNGNQSGIIEQPLATVATAEKLILSVSIDGTNARNSWDVWVYPKTNTAEPADDILVTSSLDTQARDHLKHGGKVLLMASKNSVKNPSDGKIEAGFSSIFWNTAWTGRQAPHTLGILCNPSHPVFEKFPTDFHTNWQWWYLLHDAPVLLLDSLSAADRPLVQAIDDWTRNRKLGYLHECKYDGGKLMICTLQISEKENNPVSQQMRHSILKYMKGDQFDPVNIMTKEQLSVILQ